MDQYLHPPKSLSWRYSIHLAEPKDPTGPLKYANTWPNEVAKLNSAFGCIAKPSASSSFQHSLRPISQDTLCKFEKVWYPTCEG